MRTLDQWLEKAHEVGTDIDSLMADVRAQEGESDAWRMLRESKRVLEMSARRVKRPLTIDETAQTNIRAALKDEYSKIAQERDAAVQRVKELETGLKALYESVCKG